MFTFFVPHGNTLGKKDPRRGKGEMLKYHYAIALTQFFIFIFPFRSDFFLISLRPFPGPLGGKVGG